MNRGKAMRSYRLSARTQTLLEALAQQRDTSQTQVLEDAIKEMARRNKISMPDLPTGNGLGELLPPVEETA
jgi:predicted transcriptional regulator